MWRHAGARGIDLTMSVAGGENFDYPHGVVPAQTQTLEDGRLRLNWKFPALQSGVTIRLVLPSEQSFEKVAALAEVFNAQIAPHIYCGPVAHAAAAHVALSCPNFLILETIQSDFHDAVLERPLKWEAGYLLAQTEPGPGIEIDLATVAARPYATGVRLHLDMCQTPRDSANQRTIGEVE